MMTQKRPGPPPELPKAKRTTRHSGGSADGARGLSSAGHEDAVPVYADPVAPRQTYVPIPKPAIPPMPAVVRADIRPKQPSYQQSRPSNSSMATPGSSRPQQKKQKKAPTPEKPGPGSDRNIDKIVLGNICFRAWYPSYYGKEVLGDISGNTLKANLGNINGGHSENGGAKSFSRRDRDPPILDRLYVCPCCFKYSKELVTWWEHVRVCENSGYIPGEKIYVHPRGSRMVEAPTGSSRGLKKTKGAAPIKTSEQLVFDEGEWSIWEVDGEKDVLFCQNLSLFAKLFLDNKSVFFDVTGFNYFLLVYTPSVSQLSTPAGSAEGGNPRHHIVGFFSKEKLSWDNNNLACILIFPPWQRKGLGALLMGVSYEISKREGVLGGPEKPISDLGKKGYKRFWSGEVARWILGLNLSVEEENIIDVEAISNATWIVPEDCLTVVREMGVVEEAGLGRPKGEVEKSQEEGDVEEQVEPTLVPRVRISKLAVERWVKANNISLQQACDPNGFVEGYAIKSTDGEEAEAEDEEAAAEDGTGEAA
jgi:hypothetical protein